MGWSIGLLAEHRLPEAYTCGKIHP
eukprot:SAG25_NODE_12710_length_276_cov_0.587571_1_plen_24_part_10